MKIAIVVLISLCFVGIASAEEIWKFPDGQIGIDDGVYRTNKAKGFNATPPPLSTDDIPMAVYKAQADLLILKYRMTNLEDTLDKIYSMVADLEIKFMGKERYNQIYDPTNEGEVAKQKRQSGEKR